MEKPVDGSDEEEESFYELCQVIEEGFSHENDVSPSAPAGSVSSNVTVTSQSTIITKDILGLLQSLRNLVNAKVGAKSYLSNYPRERANQLLDNLEDKFQEILPPEDISILKTNSEVQTPPTLLQSNNDFCVPNSGAFSQRRSFANVVSAPRAKTLLLYPANTPNNAESSSSSPPKVIDLLRKELKQDNFKVKNIKRIKNEGLAITTTSSEEIDKILQEIESKPILKSNIRLIPAEKKFPKCIVYGFHSEVTKEEVQASLDVQLGKGTAEVLFSIRNPTGLHHWVFKIHPGKFKFLMRLGKVSLNWEIHNVREFINVKRCTKCQALDHTRSKCPFQNTYCAYCADQHDSKDCKSNFYRCINCCLYNNNFHKQFPTHHSTVDPTCPSYQAKVKSIKRNIAYDG